jgi:hypothetical protein
MTIKEIILEQADKANQQVKESVKDLKRIALSEAWKILQLVTAGVVQVIEAIAADLEGKDKKAIAIEYIESFYDKVLVVVDIPFVPSILEPIIHRYIKSILMILVSSSIDATVTIFRQTGVFLKKGAT